MFPEVSGGIDFLKYMQIPTPVVWIFANLEFVHSKLLADIIEYITKHYFKKVYDVKVLSMDCHQRAAGVAIEHIHRAVNDNKIPRQVGGEEIPPAHVPADDDVITYESDDSSSKSE